MQMYKDRFAVAIKHNGKILREQKDLVKLPFGSEFSVLVKNLNSRRAKFTLHIDGTDVLDGEEIIVNANAEVEMKRFIKNGNMDAGNAFKFIERTAKIEDGPRGIKMDDGVVRVEFWFEQEAPEIKTTIHNDIWWDNYYHNWRYRYPYTHPYGIGPFYATSSISGTVPGNLQNGVGTEFSSTSSPLRGGLKSTGIDSAKLGSASNMVQSASYSASAGSGTATAYNCSTLGTPTMDSFTPEAKMEVDVNDAGITVPGSKVEQKFTTVYGFNSEVKSEVIIIRLVGMVGNVEVIAPVTVKTKNKCTTCDHTNKHYARFCIQCGTSLQIL